MYCTCPQLTGIWSLRNPSPGNLSPSLFRAKTLCFVLIRRLENTNSGCPSDKHGQWRALRQKRPGIPRLHQIMSYCVEDELVIMALF